jgi:cytochrome c oxidase cbb3-type subunit 3
MQAKYKKFIFLFSSVVCSPMLALADGNANNTSMDTSGFWYNPLVLSLVGIMLILLFAIGVMGNVIVNLVAVHREKMRNEKNTSNIIKTILLIILFSIPGIHTFAAEANQTASTAPSGIGGIARDDFYILVSIILFEILILLSLMLVTRVLLRGIRNIPVVTKEAKSKARSHFWDRFNRSVSVEHERDVLLDHNYDGIQELDNALPPWWKYGFYVTILFACIYLYRYEVAHTGMSSQEEYLADVQKAKEDQAAYLAKSANNIDENNVTQLTDAADLNAAKAIFESTCAACHVKDGGGLVGPNLTDDYWLHGGSIKDIFKSIKYGWQDKGMKSWKDDYSPKQIQQLASYVKSLRGTHPANPKPQQGELYIEAAPAKADSTKTDSTKINPKQVVTK